MLKKRLLWVVVALLLLGGFASYSRHELSFHQLSSPPSVSDESPARSSNFSPLLASLDSKFDYILQRIKSKAPSYTNNHISNPGQPVPEAQLQRPVKIIKMPKPPPPPKVSFNKL